MSKSKHPASALSPQAIACLLLVKAGVPVDGEEFLEALASAGLLIRTYSPGSTGPHDEPMLRVTESGERFVQMLLETPLPVMKYVDPRCED